MWDGVYTDAQAERGGMAYQQACVACHREDLRGDNNAPSLVGESFMFLWGDMEVGELSARIQKLMPPMVARTTDKSTVKATAGPTALPSTTARC